MDVWQQVGSFVELVGVGVTAWGLFGAWRQSANGEPFWPARVRSAYFKVARIWGQQPAGVTRVVSIADAVAIANSPSVTVVGSPLRTIRRRLDDLEQQTDALQNSSAMLDSKVERLDRENMAAHQRLDERIGQVSDETVRQIDRKSLADLRPAVWGLVIAGVGQLLQFVVGF